MIKFKLQLLAIALMSVEVFAHAADISVLSDFATSEILYGSVFLGQVGDGHMASVDQTTDAGGTGNYAEINQTGGGNQVFLIQTGDLNRTRVNQSESGNYASVEQRGSRNYVDLTQSGDGNSIVVSQIGDDNTIVGTQSGGGLANLSEIGNGNSIVLNRLSASTVNVSMVSSMTSQMLRSDYTLPGSSVGNGTVSLVGNNLSAIIH